MKIPESVQQNLSSFDPLLVILIGAAVGFTIAFIMAIWTLKRTGVPVYSAAPWTVRMAMTLLDLKAGERFCDLCCGLGRTLRSARRKADVIAVGYELNPFAILYLWALGITDWKIHIRLRDFRKADLSEFDAVYLYLVPHVLPGLAEQLEKQLKPGTRVVSVDLPMPGWKSVNSMEQGQKVWLYIMGRHLPAPGELPDSEALPDVQTMFNRMMSEAENSERSRGEQQQKDSDGGEKNPSKTPSESASTEQKDAASSEGLAMPAEAKEKEGGEGQAAAEKSASELASQSAAVSEQPAAASPESGVSE